MTTPAHDIEVAAAITLVAMNAIRQSVCGSDNVEYVAAMGAALDLCEVTQLVMCDMADCLSGLIGESEFVLRMNDHLAWNQTDDE